MIIHYLDVMGIAVTPRETDAPLVVDPNAVHPGAVAPQQLKSVSGRPAEVLQPPRLIEVQKLPPRGPFDALESSDHAVLKERCSVRATERPDQPLVYDV